VRVTGGCINGVPIFFIVNTIIIVVVVVVVREGRD
jgi:hypothetical protein